MSNDLSDAAIEAFDHTVGLGVSGGAEAVLDAQFSADEVEGVIARDLLVGAGESVRELAAIVGQHLLDHHGCSTFEAPQEVRAADLSLVTIDAKVDPSRGTINGDEQVTSIRLIGHLRKVLDVEMQEAGLIVFEGLFLGRFAFNHRNQILEIAHPMAAQATIESRARGLGIDEFMGDRQQVVQGQQQRAPQLNDQGFLGRRQGRAQLVWTMRAILHILSCAPLARGGLGDVVEFGHRC